MSEVKKILVVRGCLSTDELQGLGLPMAHRYQAADIVLLVGDDGLGFAVKGIPDATLVEVFDARPLDLPSAAVSVPSNDGADDDARAGHGVAP